MQPEAVPGEGSVAPEAAAEPEGAVQADRAALTESSRAPPPLEDRRRARRPPKPPSQSWAFSCRPPQLPTLTRKTSRDHASCHRDLARTKSCITWAGQVFWDLFSPQRGVTLKCAVVLKCREVGYRSLSWCNISRLLR